eukprot:3376218-Rhodomonas_salina.1
MAPRTARCSPAFGARGAQRWRPLDWLPRAARPLQQPNGNDARDGSGQGQCHAGGNSKDQDHGHGTALQRSSWHPPNGVNEAAVARPGVGMSAQTLRSAILISLSATVVFVGEAAGSEADPNFR